MLSILYLGADSPSSTSGHRLHALRRLRHTVNAVNIPQLLGSRSRTQRWIDHRIPNPLSKRHISLFIRHLVSQDRSNYDLIWVDSGDYIGPGSLRLLLTRYRCPAVLYNVDDPTGPRDYSRFSSLRSALHLYSLCVFVRPETSLEALSLGAQRVLTVHRSYDEVYHAPPSLSFPHTSQHLLFIGTLIPGEHRDRYLLRLIEAGFPISLYGDRWSRSPCWSSFKECYQGPALYGSDYSRALSSAAVSLGFLSHQNRDLITTRSLEIPACCGLFCAERTSEHQLLYEDGVEVVLWTTMDECIAKCRALLHNPDLSQKIRKAGHQHILQIGVGNEDVCRDILASV